MDRSLIEAAQTGDVDCLVNLIKNDPLILRTVALFSGDTPLHIATTAGRLNFVKELLKRRREFAAELNQDGFSPLHIASANGDVEIVKELLEADERVCRIKGREGRIALHYAVIKGRVVVIRELLSACADSVENATARGETALHLAVKNNQFEAFKMLVEHLMQHNKQDVLNNKEEHTGNTVLHLAVSRKQYEVVDFLLSEHNVPRGVMELNLKNKRCLTALDVLLCFESEAGDREIEEILVQAGAMRAVELNSCSTREIVNENLVIAVTTATKPSNKKYITQKSEHSTDQLTSYFTYDRDRDSPGDVRNCLLVIVALIVTATYQAMLSPPGGAWQDNSGSYNNTITSTSKPHIAGQAIMESRNSIVYGFFLYFNTMGFTLSLYMIGVLTDRFPMQNWLKGSLGFILITYDLSMATFAPKTAVSIFFILFTMFCQIVLAFPMSNQKRMSRRIKNVKNFINKILK